MSRELKLRCGRHWILAPSQDIHGLAAFDGPSEPAEPGRAARRGMVLDGRMLLDEPPAETISGRVAVRLAASEDEDGIRIVVDEVEGLVEGPDGRLVPLPKGLRHLAALFDAVWSQGEAAPLALRLRALEQLPLHSFALRRRLRRAVLGAGA